MSLRGFIAAGLLISAAASAETSVQVPPSRADVGAAAAFDRTIADAKAVMLINPAGAQSAAERAEAQARSIPDARQRGIAIATSRWLRGEALLRTNDIRAASTPVEQALATIAQLSPNSKLHADILLSKGGIDAEQDRVGNALRSYQAAFDIYRTINDTRGQAMSLVFMAMLYSAAQDQVSALKYNKQALEIYNSDPNLGISIYNNRGISFKELHQYDAAANQFGEALAVARRLGSPLLVATVLNNVARIHLAKGELSAADTAISGGLASANGVEALSIRAELTASAAQLALDRGDRTGAVRLIGKAFAQIDPTKTNLSMRDSHETAYDTYSAVGETKAALVHLEALKRLDDAVTKLATSTSTALMAARFDFANQELKISQLKADELQRGIAFERARVRTQRTAFVGAGIALAAIIAMLIFALVTVRRSRNTVRAANDDLAVTNAALGKALAAKTEFLATTSHEIRTPLNGILGMTQVMLADPTLAHALRDRIGIVHGAGVTMRALVDDILDVAKMETGNLTIEAVPFDLCATVRDATRMWEDQARAKGLAFTVHLDGCPALILGDPARVRQIVFNLLSNALKFTKVGHVALSVALDGDRQLRMAVSDSGIGIPAEKLNEVFESFRQADAGTTRQFGGTGLGLSICRNLARAMGGDVTVTSVEGVGSTFTLALPLMLAPSTSASAAQCDESATLVVDRNPITRSMFRTLLAPHCGPVVIAASAEEAVDRLKEGGIVRVLIDDATMRVGGDAIGAITAIASAARATGADTTLLWAVAAGAELLELQGTGVTRIVSRPITGGALVDAMFGKLVSNKDAKLDLVSYAA